MKEFIVAGIGIFVFILLLCAVAFLVGYKKGVQDMVDFHKAVWNAMEKETQEANHDE